MRVLKVLADAEHQGFPESAKIISRDIYMDDILLGALSLTSAKKFQFGLSELIRRGEDFNCINGGADARDLRDNDLWWQGPDFLLRNISDPEEYPCPKDKTFEQELKTTVAVSCAVANVSDFLDKLLNITNN
ncbi:hypothetical protein AVEN_32439-1 [Araneus ventricosus]|uniref:Uncharacterized protein n=1 Tax=Araneus ventricosus TaxID=182803 RepID=A0A4Y2NXM0_ARAVE|nr:hypothetical protein AVEN_32439-1 [Araneus ventricosus]